MSIQKDAYRMIAERYGMADSELFSKVLKGMITPEESGILSEIDKPLSLSELAEKTGTGEEELKTQLDAMMKKGLIGLMGDRYSLWEMPTGALC